MGNFLAAMALMALSFILGATVAIERKNSEAFERGYMVECLGREGYYWECEE